MSIDIRSLSRQLSQLITNPPVGSKRRPGAAISVLNQLREKPMTLETLLKTKVGITVNKIRAQNWSQEVNQLAAQVIKEWEQLLPKKCKNKKKVISNDKSSGKKSTKNDRPRAKDVDRKEPNVFKSKKIVDKLLNSVTDKSKTMENPVDSPVIRPLAKQKSNVMNEVVNKLVGNSVSKPVNRSLDKTIIKSLNIPASHLDKPDETQSKVLDQPKSNVNGKEAKKTQEQTIQPNKVSIESNKENIFEKPSQPVIKNKNKFLNKTLEPKVKKFKKLLPIGQTPEYSADRLRQRRVQNDIRQTVDGYSSTLTKPLAVIPVTTGVGGHQLYETIVRKRKQERTFKIDSPRKRAATFATVNVERYNNFNSLSDKPRVENWPVPHSVPVLTPADRLKIIQSRSLTETPEQSTSKVLAFKDEHEIELDTWRVRSVKSFNRVVPRVEHKPKWMGKNN